MKTSRRPRQSTTMANSRWASYAAAGAATAFMSIPTAEAEIHYSGIVNHKFSGGHTTSHASFPLNNGASLRFVHGSQMGSGEARLTIPAPGVFQTFGAFAGSLVRYGGLYLSNLDNRINLSGLQFKSSCRFSSTNSVTNCYGGVIGLGYSQHGKFMEAGTGFIAFRFNTGAGLQYGWARIRTTGDPKNRFALLDYAWGDPGDAIQTGQKHGSARESAGSKAGSVGLLALGGAGLFAWRRQRATAHQP